KSDQTPAGRGLVGDGSAPSPARVPRNDAERFNASGNNSRMPPMKWPRIRSRRTTAVSPWVSIIAREVEFSRGSAPQTYHAVEQPDYISIVALTSSGKIPIVRQYRPALEAFAWELPAGLLDPRAKPAPGRPRQPPGENRVTPPPPHAPPPNTP